MQHYAPDAELGIVGPPRHGNVEMDLTFPVLHQGNGKTHRKGGGLVTLDLFAEGKLVDEHFVLGFEFLVLDMVLEVEEELPLVHRIAQEGA